MKKLVLMGIALFFILGVGVRMQAADNKLSPSSPVQEEKGSHANDMVHALLFYIPNRLIDATDIFTITFGVGGHAAMDVHLTNYFQLGGWSGPNYFLTKGYARQYGGGYQHGSKGGILCYDYDDLFVSDTFGTVKEYYVDQTSFGLTSPDLDAYKEKDLDFWAIGAEAGWLFNVKVNIHPLEIADFITGIVFYDLMGDDI